jgi:hypothetical protein
MRTLSERGARDLTAIAQARAHNLASAHGMKAEQPQRPNYEVPATYDRLSRTTSSALCTDTLNDRALYESRPECPTTTSKCCIKCAVIFEKRSYRGAEDNSSLRHVRSRNP